MSENTNENPEKNFTLEPTRISAIDEIESAKILFQEGLLEEAKKKLYQVLIQAPGFAPAKNLLDKIFKDEERTLLESSSRTPSQKKAKPENPDPILKKLEEDLGISLGESLPTGDQENWVSNESLSAKEHYDLGVAFFEMECYSDAIRELRKAERKIRLEQTFLGELGVSVVALLCESWIKAGRAFEAKSHLEPVLSEPDLRFEEKIILFYLMGVIEEDLGHLPESRSWLQKVVDSDPAFRDAQFRLKRK